MIALGNTEITKTYLGSTEVSKMYLGEDLVFGGSSPTPVLPYDAQVEYLQSDGSAYIDTGINLREVVSMTASMSLATSISSNQMLFGVFYDNSTLPKFHIYINKSRKWAGLNNNYFTFSGVSNGSTVYVGTTYNPTVTAKSAQAYDATIYMFARNNDHNDLVYSNAIRIYSCQITRGNVLVRDFIPVRKNNVGYMYDKVSNSLFGNVNTGAFTYGNDVTT